MDNNLISGIPVNAAVPTDRDKTADRPENTVNLLELIGAVLQHWFILLLCLVVGSIGSGIFTYFFITPMYQSTSMIYIYSKTTSITSLADLQIGSQLTVDFQIIATTREVVENTIDSLDLDISYHDLSERITISNPDNSRILEIKVKDEDPQRAADISNSLADELRSRIAQVMNTDEPSMVQDAVPAKKPVSPSLVKNMILGGLGLCLAAAVILLISVYLDDRIKTESDVEKYLHLNVLAVVSKNPNMVKKH